MGLSALLESVDERDDEGLFDLHEDSHRGVIRGPQTGRGAVVLLLTHGPGDGEPGLHVPGEDQVDALAEGRGRVGQILGLAAGESVRGKAPALGPGIGVSGAEHHLVGCARGIDQRFRSTLAVSNAAKDSSFIACAFASRVEGAQKEGLFASLVVPQGLSPAAALRRRTLWMVKRSVLLFLFPDDPATGKWGRGSRLAYRAALDQLKPVFVVTSHPPAESSDYHLVPSSYFGIVDGYWVVPHPVPEGTCDEEW